MPSAAASAVVPGTAPRAGDPPPSSVAALLTSAPSSTIARNSRSRRPAGTPVESTSAPTTWTCIAKPSAVEPSTAPSAISTSAASAIRAPSPPAGSGTTRRCSPASTIACAARGSNSSPSSSASKPLEEIGRDRRHGALRGRHGAFVVQALRSDELARPGRLDERIEAPFARGRLLGARHPVRYSLAIRGRAGLPVGPGGRVPLEPGELVSAEVVDRTLVGVDRGLRVRARLERTEPRRAHPALGGQSGDLGHVDRAPVAALPAGREPLRVADLVEPLELAVDPADAQRLVDGVRPADGRPAARLLVLAEPQLGGRLVVRVEPVAQLGRRREEADVVRDELHHRVAGPGRIIRPV